MARSVYLPRDWGPRRAHGVVSGRTGGGTGVVGDLAPLVAVDDHASHEIRVVVVLVVDDGENLRLHTNVEVELVTADNSCKRRTIDIAENPVVERSLVLVRRTTRADGRVRPVDFVSFADFHANAVLPVVFLGVHFDRGIIFVASTPQSSTFGEELTVRRRAWSTSGLVVLADGEMFRTQVPVNVDRAQFLLVVRLLDWLVRPHIQASFVTHGNVPSGLLNTGDKFVGAGPVIESTIKIRLNRLFLAFARICTAHRRLGRHWCVFRFHT
mmetsp:Transcript_1323/g.4118  ORF Transcript_1323/g.4118 Transcript_1323/m.4118 type:complete len:269 (-) Transcript_1323:497-1303(-)